MKNAKNARREREEDWKARTEDRKFQQQQIYADRKAREADREFFEQLMKIQIMNGKPLQPIDSLPKSIHTPHQTNNHSAQKSIAQKTTNQPPQSARKTKCAMIIFM